MSKQHDEALVEVIGPQGQRKWLPPAAANAPEIRVLGFTPVKDIMPPVRVSAAATGPVLDPVAGEEAQGDEVAPPKKAAKTKAA